MFLFTSYSVFFLTEIRYRFFFLLISSFLVCFYTGTFFNYFLVDFLEPIEYMYLDWSTSFMYKYLFELLKFVNIGFSHEVKNQTVYSIHTIINNVSDYYPVFEINISQNTYLYFYLLCYFCISFMIPLFIYHIYLFLVPGLFLYELQFIQFFFFKFLFFYFLFFFFLKKIVLVFFLNITYNNYYEFLNYEFDFVFDIFSYVICNFNLTCLFICYFLLYLSIIKSNNIFFFSFIIINIIFMYSFFINVFFFFFFFFFFSVISQN